MALGTTPNGIANNGDVVGFAINNTDTLTNFVRNPDGTFTSLNLGIPNVMAMGINSVDDLVGAADGSAFFLPCPGCSLQTTRATV